MLQLSPPPPGREGGHSCTVLRGIAVRMLNRGFHGVQPWEAKTETEKPWTQERERVGNAEMQT